MRNERKYLTDHQSVDSSIRCKYCGSSRIELRMTSGRAPRTRSAVGNGPRTPIGRTPARRDISMFSAVSPT